MRTHDPTPGRHALIEHRLHDRYLINAGWQPYAVALPIRACPGRFMRQDQAGNICKHLSVANRQASASFYNSWQLLQLLPPNGCLHIRHSVVEARHRIVFEDDLGATVAHRVRNTHSMLTPETELAIPVCVARGDHATFACRHDLPRMERKAGHVSMRSTDRLPGAIDQNLGAGGAGGILDQRHTERARDCQDALQVTRHAYLMHAQDLLACVR